MSAHPAHATARPLAHHPVVRRPVFVPPPPVIELDEISPPDLPKALSDEERDRYRRIFQAQASGQWAAADAEIAQLKDKTLMGYVGAQRLLSPATRRRTTSSRPGCRTTTTIPMRRRSTSWR